MSFFEILILLFLVVDPFGNIPLVIMLLKDKSDVEFRGILYRETALAFVIMLVFYFAGGALLGYLNITQNALRVAGGVILFLISVKMIFRGTEEIFEDRGTGPVVVPIAVPSMAGPATLTTLMILRTRSGVETWSVLGALALVVCFQLVLFILGRPMSRWLGQQGIKALEKLTGLILNLIAVNMILQGVAGVV